MNIIADTKQNLTDAIMHYVCMRLQFRSSVLAEQLPASVMDKRYEDFCPVKH